jgi:hypothetical protein
LSAGYSGTSLPETFVRSAASGRTHSRIGDSIKAAPVGCFLRSGVESSAFGEHGSVIGA